MHNVLLAAILSFVVLTTLVVTGKSQSLLPEDDIYVPKRSWNNFQGGYGKRSWNKFQGGYGKRNVDQNDMEYLENENDDENRAEEQFVKRAWNSGFAGGMGKRAWNSGFDGGMGKRGWNNGFTGGMGKRAWNSGFAGGMGKRAWNSGYAGGMGKRTEHEDHQSKYDAKDNLREKLIQNNRNSWDKRNRLISNLRNALLISPQKLKEWQNKRMEGGWMALRGMWGRR